MRVHSIYGTSKWFRTFRFYDYNFMYKPFKLFSSSNTTKILWVYLHFLHFSTIFLSHGYYNTQVWSTGFILKASNGKSWIRSVSYSNVLKWQYSHKHDSPCACWSSVPQPHCETKQQSVLGRPVSDIQTRGVYHLLLDELLAFWKTLEQCHRFVCENKKKNYILYARPYCCKLQCLYFMMVRRIYSVGMR